MRPVARNLVVAVLLSVALLLALGALPSLLKTGDPYHLRATPVEDTPDGVTSVDVTNFSQRRFPYTFGALDGTSGGDEAGREAGSEGEGEAGDETGETGLSDPYWTGPLEVKEAFAHSPFDEVDAYREQHGGAVRGDRVYVNYEGRSYRLEVINP